MKRNGLKKVLSVVMVCAVLLSQMVCGFAAADPTENTVIQYLTDGWTDNGSNGGIVDFSTIDEGLEWGAEPHGSPDIAHYDAMSTLRLGHLFGEYVIAAYGVHHTK